MRPGNGKAGRRAEAKSSPKTTDWWGPFQIAIADAQAKGRPAQVDWEYLAAAIAECEELRAERRRLEEEIEGLQATKDILCLAKGKLSGDLRRVEYENGRLRAEVERWEGKADRALEEATTAVRGQESSKNAEQTVREFMQGDAEADKRVDELMAKQSARGLRPEALIEASDAIWRSFAGRMGATPPRKPERKDEPFEVSIEEEEAGLLCIGTPRGCMPFLTWKEFEALESTLRAWAQGQSHGYKVRRGLLDSNGNLLPHPVREERGEALEAMQRAERARLGR